MIDAVMVKIVQQETKFRHATVEQVLNMFSVLKMIVDDPELGKNYVLIGGTAINLFDSKIPRLSVDLDFDYINKKGAPFEQKIIENHVSIIERISKELDMDFLMTTNISSNRVCIHLPYKSHYNPSGEDIVKLDISYLFQSTILPPIQRKFTQLHPDDGFENLSVLTAHPSELWAGKALALVYNSEKDPKPAEVRDLYSMFIARHLFDVSRMEMKLKNNEAILDIEKMRLCFILKGVVRMTDFYFLRGSMLRHCPQSEIKNQLFPFLVEEEDQGSRNNDVESFLNDMKIHSIDFLNKVCCNIWDDNQKCFVRTFQEKGEYHPELLFGKDNSEYSHLYDNEYLKESAKNISR